MRSLPAVVACTALLALAGCQPGDATTAVDVDDAAVGRILPAAPGADDAPGDDAPGDDAAGPTAPDDGAGEALDRCDATLARTLVAAVDGQLAAIVEERWADALTFATPGFRAGTDPASFAAVITDGFPVVAAADGREIGRCLLRSSGDQATMAVLVVDADGTEQSLLYLFELGEDGWGIAGAVPTPTGDEAPDGTLTT